jgi:hypothetical protein
MLKMKQGLLVLLLLASCSVSAREWFVSPSGDDERGNGSIGKPYRSVSRVLDTSIGVVSAGDVISLREGRYEECDVRLRMPLTLRAHEKERAHIHCDMRVKDSVVIQIDPDASGSRVAGLELSGGMYYAIQLQTAWEREAYENGKGASNIILEDLKIHSTGRDGIKITPKCEHVTIRRSEIWNTGAGYAPSTPSEDRNAEGIDNVNAAHMIVEDNYIHDIASTGIYFKGGASDALVQRNRIERTGFAGILVGFDTSEEYFDLKQNPGYYESIRGIVRNNIVRDTQYAGIGLYAAKDALILNNTIVNTAQKGHAALYFGVPLQDEDERAKRPSSANPTIRNNLIVQKAGACIEVRWIPRLGGLSGLAGKPNTDWNGYQALHGSCRFVDLRPQKLIASVGSFEIWKRVEESDANSLFADFRLDAKAVPSATSPALGRGQTHSKLIDDFFGKERGEKVDLGAIQRASLTD